MDARAPSPPVAPPQLLDENIEDILLRIPPDDPARLLRAALACKSWARLIVADSGFRRRYRQRHGAAPMLGFIVNVGSLTSGVARFVSATPFRAAHGERHGYRAQDARHGRVLLHRRPASDVPSDSAFSVWDPISDEELELPVLELPRQVQSWNAAVLCGGAAATCDHVDCRPPGPFRVVFFGADADGIFVHVYSSESGAWSEGPSMNIPDDDHVEAGYVFDETLPGVLAGNALYFLFLDGTKILKYDLAMATLSVIPLPPFPIDRRMVLITMEDGGLGSTEMNSRYSLTLWKLETTTGNPAARWARSKVFDLKLHLFRDALLVKPSVVAFAEIAGAIFLETAHGLYTFDLKTGESVKVMGNYFEEIVPFVSFYTPAPEPPPPSSHGSCRTLSSRTSSLDESGGPVLLGLLANLAISGGAARFIPARGFCFCPAPADRRGYRAHDARHGRVLLNRLPAPEQTGAPQGQAQAEVSALAVWDLITDELHHLPQLLRHRPVHNWNAAVLGGGAADPGHFRVVLVGIDAKVIFSCIYSSDSGTWGTPTTARLTDDQLDMALPGVQAWNAMHFVFLKGTGILKCDLTTGKMSLISMPTGQPAYGPRVVLMTTEDGGLGFAEVCFRTGNLRLWAIEIGPERNGGQWAVTRSISLFQQLPAQAFSVRGPPVVVAFADGAGVVFLKSVDNNDVLYGFDLKSGEVSRIAMVGGFYDVVPFVGFYTPVLKAALITSGQGSSAGASGTA